MIDALRKMCVGDMSKCLGWRRIEENSVLQANVQLLAVWGQKPCFVVFAYAFGVNIPNVIDLPLW